LVLSTADPSGEKSVGAGCVLKLVTPLVTRVTTCEVPNTGVKIRVDISVGAKAMVVLA
jgi:hypothetical protein